MKGEKKLKIQESDRSLLDDTHIVSFDVQCDSAPTDPLLHKHSRFLYILEGRAKIKIQNQIYDMIPGAVIALLPWQISEIVEVSEPVSYYLLIYDFNLLNVYIKNDLNVNDEDISFIDSLYQNNAVIATEEVTQKFRSIFEDIKQEVGVSTLDLGGESGKYSTVYLLVKLAELLILYLRHAETSAKEISAQRTPEKIFEYLFLNSSKDLSLSLLSRIFLMSESSISKYITDLTGIGFYDLLHEMRLFKAHFLLLHTNMSLQDIARSIHYADPAQLSRIFSEKHGLNTKAFQKINQHVANLSNQRLDPRSLKIIDYIYENYAEDIDILQVSELFQIPPRSINKILVYYVERNFQNFLHQIRIYRACDLLLETDDPIMDIALAVGYQSTKTFTRNFLKILSVTPADFRKAGR